MHVHESINEMLGPAQLKLAHKSILFELNQNGYIIYFSQTQNKQIDSHN